MDRFQQNPRNWPIVEVCDPAERRGLHVCWFVFDPDDYVYLQHAAHIPPGPITAMVAELKRERSFLAHPPDFAIMDRLGGAHQIDLESQETWFDRFHRLGIHYVPSVAPARNLQTSITIAWEWLKPTVHPTTGLPVAKLRINRDVTRRLKDNPLWALKTMQWDPFETKPWHYRQKPKDMVDCILMLVTYPNLTYRRLMRTAQTESALAGGLASSYRRRLPVRDGIHGSVGFPARSYANLQAGRSRSRAWSGLRRPNSGNGWRSGSGGY